MYLKTYENLYFNVLVKFFSLSTFCVFFTVHKILSQIFLFCLKYRLYTGGQISVFCNLKNSTGKKKWLKERENQCPLLYYTI